MVSLSLLLVLASATAFPFVLRDTASSNASSTLKLHAVSGISTEYLDTWSDISYPDVKNCNATKLKFINKYYQDFIEVTSVARAHLLENSKDSLFKYWFGSGNPITVLGVIDTVMQGNKDGVLYRCDDVDGLCAANPTTYPGYHRTNATQETVLCDLFFDSKLPLEEMCVVGDIFTIGAKKFAGIDLFHRFLHLTSINKGFAGEYTDDLAGALDYSKNNASYAVINTLNVLYYIADAYSNELTTGGCLGTYSSNSTTGSD